MGRHVSGKMLWITVELVPGGLVNRAFVIARATATYMSEGHPCDCQVIASEGGSRVAGRRAWTARGMVGQHDRRRSVWALVEKVSK